MLHTLTAPARWIAGVSTSRFILVAVLAAPAAWICKPLRRFAYERQLHDLSSFLDLAGFGLFLFSYALLWLLLVAGPFRPASQFTLHGDANRRVQNFFFTAVALLALHLAIAFAVATAGS